jgi:hypothetical protein
MQQFMGSMAAGLLEIVLVEFFDERIAMGNANGFGFIDSVKCLARNLAISGSRT